MIKHSLLGGILLVAVFTAWGAEPGHYSQEINAESVRRVVNDAIWWQFDHMPDQGRARWNPKYTGWSDGTFLSAVSDWAGYDDSRGFKARYKKIAEDLNWEVGARSLNPANDVSLAVMYGNIWKDDPQEKYIVDTIVDWDYKTIIALFGGWSPLIPTISRLDYMMKYCPKTDNLNFEVAQNQERWCWSDALYMGPPAYALFASITGNEKYLEFMDREYWATVAALYDKKERLMYRDTRYIAQRELNGAKVFWGRGNGWVVAGLARVLDFLPEDYPSRPKYVALFQEMMSRIATLQDEAGYWRTSLLDYEHYTSPETSASGFFTYALWWGINRGILDEKQYKPVAVKAWKAMVRAVNADGMLGYVQPIGDAPQNISADKNEVYGTAAFALAGLEVARYADKHNK